jgi:formyltetrahydrofolate deformylase
MTPTTTATLLVSCPDRTGLVAALSQFVFESGGNILDADQHAEAESGMFFMRLVWDLAGSRLTGPDLPAAIGVLARRFDLSWHLTTDAQRPRVVVFASQVPHCLYDLLLAEQLGDLAGDIVAVIANHPDLGRVAGHFGTAFHHIPLAAGDPAAKAAAEAAQRRILADTGADLVVLARYMQVLSPDLCADWHGKIINIHHSFLPAFVGARPYHQAKARGVKVIGATAHYVTPDLDQGPIIEQGTTRVSHRDEVEDLIRKGRDLERQTLTRAVRLHLERRVLISGNRTIVFA